MTQQEIHEGAQGTRSPEQVFMTLAEFLENDVDGYEYVKGELVPIPPAPRIHSKMRVKVMILPHMRRMMMYWELRKKMPEIIEKAVAEAVPKAMAETRREDFARFKRFCEKHGITYTEEDWADETLDNGDE